MIVQAKMRLENMMAPVDPSLAYPLYAWLLSHVPAEVGNRFHEQGARPINQCLRDDPQTKECWWTVNLLDDEAVRLFEPVLKREREAKLHSRMLCFASCTLERLDSPYVFIKRGRELELDRRFPLELVTPTSFKQNGRYVIFPQESLILQSLIMRWGLCFPDMPLDDADAFEAILRGIHIVDYRLQTLRYPLKQAKIPSFVGRVVLEPRLSAPLREVFKTLYCFAPYAGLGIKTALGMGGIRIGSAEE